MQNKNKNPVLIARFRFERDFLVFLIGINSFIFFIGDTVTYL